LDSEKNFLTEARAKQVGDIFEESKEKSKQQQNNQPEVNAKKLKVKGNEYENKAVVVKEVLAETSVDGLAFDETIRDLDLSMQTAEDALDEVEQIFL
jgi:cobalamin biosynthesis protein CobT